MRQGGQRWRSWRAIQFRLQSFNAQVDVIPVLLDQSPSLTFRLDEAYVTKQLLAGLRPCAPPGESYRSPVACAAGRWHCRNWHGGAYRRQR
jgi:hypothetical protein